MLHGSACDGFLHPCCLHCTTVDCTTVAVHGLLSGKRVHNITTASTCTTLAGVALSPDGTRLVTFAPNSAPSIFDVKSGQFIRHDILTQLPTSIYWDMQFSPNSRLLVGTGVAGSDGSAGAIYVVDLDHDTIAMQLGDSVSTSGGMCKSGRFDSSGDRIAFTSTQRGCDELICVSTEAGSGGSVKELCRIPTGTALHFRGFSVGDNTLMLCAPMTDLEQWAVGSSLRVHDVATQAEVEWSPLLPLAFGADFIPFSSVGWVPPPCTSRVQASAHVIHAVVGSEVILVDIAQFKVAVADGALTASQLIELLKISPEHVATLVQRLPQGVNIRDSGTGETVLHIRAMSKASAAFWVAIRAQSTRQSSMPTVSLHSSWRSNTNSELASRNCGKI